MWDLEDAHRPERIRLRGGKVAGRQIAALGFGARATRLFALTSGGRLYEFDVLAHRRISARSLREAHGDLPWSARRDPFRIAAACFVSEEYSPDTTLLVATAGDGVARINLDRFDGRTIIPGSEIAGSISTITEYPATHAIVLGTSVGTVKWDPKYRDASIERTGANVGLTLQGSVLVATNARGVASVDLSTADSIGGSLPAFSGRPAEALLGGSGGAVEIGADGSISLLDPGKTGMNLETSGAESTIVATFGPEGNLLETSGWDANHIQSLVAVRPGSPGVAGSDTEPNRVVRRYLPSKSWWPPESGNSRGLFIDDAYLGGRYVLAGGQDPTGTAVVLVWNAKTGKPLRRLTLTTSGIDTKELRSETPSLVSEVTLLPKRHLIAAYSALQELIALWSTESWRRVRTIDVGPIDGFSVSPDETTLLVNSLSDRQSETDAGNAHTRLLFVDVESGQTEHEVTSEGTQLATYTPHGRILVLQSGGLVRQLALDGRSAVAPPMTIEYGDPRSLSWKPRSNIIAVGLGSGGVRLVDLSSERVSDALPSAPGTEAVAVSFSPDGRLLAASNATTTGEPHSQTAPSIWKLDDRDLERRACELAGGGPTPGQWRAWTRSLPFEPLCGATSPAPTGRTGRGGGG
jgi:hypothetical protein